MKKLILSLTLLFLILSMDAFACTCAPMDDWTAYRDADVVFKGRVIGMIEFPDDYQIEVKFEVLENGKGNSSRYVHVRTAMFEATCGYDFKINGIYIVHSKRNKGRLSTDICSGNKILN